MLIPGVVGWLKMTSAERINVMRGTPGAPVWQRNYWEHVVRDGESLHRIREYIASNPQRWHLDRQNPDRIGEDDFDRRLVGPFGPAAKQPLVDRTVVSTKCRSLCRRFAPSFS